MRNEAPNFKPVVLSKYQAMWEAEDCVGGGTILACAEVRGGWLCNVRANDGLRYVVRVGYLTTEISHSY